jgi:long-chain acyl-CoA synthetase
MDRIDIHFLLFDKFAYAKENAQEIPGFVFLEKRFMLFKRKTEDKIPKDYYALNPAFIRFSSGTTGVSKGVLLSHEAIIERTQAADRGLKIQSSDCIMWVFSMSFHFVVTIILFLRRRATIVLCGSDFPQSLVRGLTENQGTFLYASPFHYYIMNKNEVFKRNQLSNVRMAVSTAMRLPLGCARDFAEKFKIRLSQAYGIIEVGLVGINDAQEDKILSVGRILPDYKAMIFEPNSEGVGEVCLKGKGMFGAYFSPWENAARVMPDGWFHTQDLGRIDEDGFLFLVGRKKDVVNYLGMKIFPYEIEEVINRYPAIKESYVYGVEHEQYGQVPAVSIVLKSEERSSFEEEGLRRFCYRNLAAHKVPKEFNIVGALEKTASGKIKRSSKN